MKRPAAAMKGRAAAKPKDNRIESPEDMAYYTDSSDVDMQIASKEDSQPAWADQGVDFGIAWQASVDWAREAVRRLQSGRLLGQRGKTLQLQIWADCGGVGTAKIAGDELARALAEEHQIDARVVLHTYCDKDPRAHRFVTQNMQPTHLATSMENRNLKKRCTIATSAPGITSSQWAGSTCMSQAFRATHGLGGESARVGNIPMYYQ